MAMSTGMMQGIGAASAMAGDVISSGLAFHSASKAWRRQKKAVKRMDSWRRVGLERAGYNPLIPFMGSGGGATPPAVQQARVSGIDTSKAMDAGTRYAKLSPEAKLLEANRVQAYADSFLKDEQTRLAGAQTWAQQELARNYQEMNKLYREEIRRTRAQADQAELLIPGLRNQADVEKSDLGKGAAYIDRITRTGAGIKDTLSPIPRGR